MEKKNNIFQRIKKFVLGRKSKIKRYLKWYRVYDNKKHFVIKQKILNFIMMIVILIISMIGIFLFFYAINDYKIENIIDLNKEFSIESKDLLTAQISNTLIMISIKKIFNLNMKV